MQGYLVISGSPTVQNLISFNRLVDWGERERSQQEIVAGLAPEMAQVAGLRAFAANPAPLGQSIRSRPVEMVIQTSQSYRDLERSEEHTSELQSLMRISYAVFCLKQQTIKHI